MKAARSLARFGATLLVLRTATIPGTVAAADPPAIAEQSARVRVGNWNWHVQNTDIVQGYPGFPARYSGPSSLPNGGQTRETVSLDLFAGVCLWRGAEAHVDGLIWQGFGIGNALGVEGFPNGEAFRLGGSVPNVNIARLFIRQIIGLGGDQEDVADDLLQLAGKRDVPRLTLTLGKISAKDIFDGNAHANDPRTQFMNWSLMANEAWDYPADSLGYMTGFSAELNQPQWAVRDGFFQMPRVSNGVAQDSHYLEAWGMVTEFERRFAVRNHPGTVRLLAFVNRAHMGSYQEAVDSPVRPADISATRDYRYKHGFGLNVDQEIVRNVGLFSRLGWSDGHAEGWTFADVDHTATFGVSVKGGLWRRPHDTVGLAGIVNGISRVHQRFFQAGGTGILAGDGALSHGLEEIIELYHDVELPWHLHGTLDYQFVSHPAFNRDRGPVHILAARLHWQF